MEIANVLASNVKRKRITAQKAQQYLQLFKQAPLNRDDHFSMENCLTLALEHHLSVYDAIYLELAQRTQSPLATLDQKLQQAAISLNVLYT